MHEWKKIGQVTKEIQTKTIKYIIYILKDKLQG